MGTNFYARRIPDKKKRQDLCRLIELNDWRKINEEVSNTYGSFTVSCGEPSGGEIHLGKRSGGWKFLWNPNIYEIRNGHTEWEEIEPGHSTGHWVEEPSTAYKVYDLTKESIKKFIDSEDIEIYDEYGDKQDKKEFWEMAINWIDWKGKEAWDGKTYELWERENNPKHRVYSYRTQYCDFLINQGYDVQWPYTDFYSDGLRFATNTEFS